MPAAYLDWLADLFDEAQVPYDASTAGYLDVAMRRIVAGPTEPEEEVFRRLREKWLRHGPSGRQLLVSLIRDEVFARRDSPMRPKEGGGYYTNAYQLHEPVVPHNRRT